MISRNNTSIKVVNDDMLLNSVKRVKEGAIMGIVGIMNVHGLNFLVVITEVEVVGTLKGVNINKISQVRLLPFKVSIFSRKLIGCLGRYS